jgi:hypothetical protein
MATTGVSSTSTTSASDAAAAASKAAVKQNIIKTLGAGSGIDTSALAQRKNLQTSAAGPPS